MLLNDSLSAQKTNTTKMDRNGSRTWKLGQKQGCRDLNVMNYRLQGLLYRYRSLLHPERRRAPANGRASLQNLSSLGSCTGRGRIRFLGSAKRDCSSSSPRLVLRPNQELRRTVVCNAGCCAPFEGPSSSRLHLSSSRRLPHSTYFVIRSVS